MANIFLRPFPQKPKLESVITTAACASINSTSPTNTVLLFTAGADGDTVVSISALPRGTVTASNLLLFISYDGGSTKYLLDSELMSAFTVAATTKIPSTVFGKHTQINPLYLPSGASLYVGNQVALADGVAWSCNSLGFST